MLQIFIHYSLHFIFPIFIALFFFKQDWKRVYGIFLLTMLVDADHLLATPIFDPNRCSVGFHLLHSYYAITVYFLLLLIAQKTWIKVVCIGLLFHMFTDSMDCLMTKYL